jgi:hypothetical protein
VNIVSVFLRYILLNCPPEQDLEQDESEHLVEFSVGARKMGTRIHSGAEIRAIADGELILYTRRDGTPYEAVAHRRALLEAKPVLKVVDGKPIVTDGLLGQITCEALAMRLSS